MSSIRIDRDEGHESRKIPLNAVKSRALHLHGLYISLVLRVHWQVLGRYAWEICSNATTELASLCSS